MSAEVLRVNRAQLTLYSGHRLHEGEWCAQRGSPGVAYR